MADEDRIENLLQTIGGSVPAWTAVAQAQLGADPFRNLCQIQTSGTTGSGWLSTDGHVYTAAHVVFNRTNCKVRFAGSSNWIPAQSVRIHPDYENLNGSGRKGSAADLARIDLPTGATALPGLQTAAYTTGSVSAIGYAGGTLVQHSGTAMRWEAFICHRADTDPGHSGCPVMAGNKVVGIHVAPLSLVRQYFAAHSAQTNPYFNGAVRFGAAQISALASQ
jgi:V8-like Glu-specific endopeptidase